MVIESTTSRFNEITLGHTRIRHDWPGVDLVQCNGLHSVILN